MEAEGLGSPSLSVSCSSSHLRQVTLFIRLTFVFSLLAAALDKSLASYPPCEFPINLEHLLYSSVELLAHQNRTIALASDFRIDGAESPEIPQKEGVSASKIAARNHKSLATFHRTLKSQSLGNR